MAWEYFNERGSVPKNCSQTRDTSPRVAWLLARRSWGRHSAELALFEHDA